MIKKLSKILFISALAFSLSISIFAAKSGQCGDNIIWNFSDDTLTLTGSGEMYDYESDGTPWVEYSTDIKEIIIDDNITSIGEYAFSGTRIDTVFLPKELRELSFGAFSSCTVLKEFEVHPENEYFVVDDGVLYDWKKHTLYAYPAAKEDSLFTVPDGVYYVSAYAFHNCRNLQTLIFPDGIESIGSFAFINTENLESIYIPDSIDKSGNLLFNSNNRITIYGIEGSKAEELAEKYGIDFSTDEVFISSVDFTYADGVLTIHGEGAIRSYIAGQAPWYGHRADTAKVVIEEGITRISFGAFHGFYNVEEVEISASVKIIEDLFQNCLSLGSFYVSDGSKYFLTDDGVIFSKDKKKIVRYPEGRNDAHYSIPDGVTEICDDAFNGAQFDAVDIPDSVKKIGNNAFLNCSRLTAVRIPDGVTELKPYSFNSKYLTGVYIPESVGKITNAFGDTQKITIYGEKGSYAEEYAKKNGIKFSTEDMPDTFFSWFFENGVLTIKNIGKMERYNSYNNPAPWMIYQDEIKEVILCEGITTVGEYAFNQCRLLEKVTLPETVTEINVGAFSFCSSLSEINFPNALTKISTYAFYRCDSLCEIKLSDNLKRIYEDAFLGCGIKELTLPEGLEYIGLRAFALCDNLKTVTIPKSVSEMRDFPFLSCKRLSAVDVDAENQHFSSEEGVLFNKDKTVLIGYPAGKQTTVYQVPRSVTAIGNQALGGGIGLVALLFETEINTVGENVFSQYNSRMSVHAYADNTVLRDAAEGHVAFVPIKADTTAVKLNRLYDILHDLKNLTSAEQVNTILTQLHMLAE